MTTFAVGLYKDGKDSSGGSDVLVGHVPIELSHLVCTFLNAEDSNEVACMTCALFRVRSAWLIKRLSCRLAMKAMPRLSESGL